MIQTPLTLPCGLTLKNRIAKAAMSEALADRRGDPSPALIDLYRRWGEGGAGLLVTGNTPVDPDHREHAANVVLDERTDLSAMARLAAAAKAGGAAVFAQLAHAGRQTPEALNPAPLSVSSIRTSLPGFGRPRAATADELEGVARRFARSAALAERADFDGVEIHAAHGYLISSSLSPRINDRDDGWGGSLDGRARLARLTLSAVRAAVSRSFAVAVKLNAADFQPGGFSAEDSLAVAAMLAENGADLIEISGGTFEAPVSYRHGPAPKSEEEEGFFLRHARAVRAAVAAPVMATGGFRSRAGVEAALVSGAVDVVGMARPFALAPGFAADFVAGRTDAAPAAERGFPAAEDLPRGAALNWFCDQIERRAAGEDDPAATPLLTGHERYLARIEAETARRRRADFRTVSSPPVALITKPEA